MSTVDLVEVASVLPSYLQDCLPYESFNAMQARCLDAWRTDSNMLITAPTGSGKTICFELAILREIDKAVQRLEQEHLGATGLGSKIVFIAPTKALCAEKADDWTRRYTNVGLRVETVTGDFSSARADPRLFNADLILTTAEKWDSITRIPATQDGTDVLGQVSLLLLDEVHHLGESRGATLESVVTRMLVVNDQSGRQKSVDVGIGGVGTLRVVAASATVKNAADVATWLRVEPHQLKQFDQSYRPVPLQYEVIGYHTRNRWQASKVFDGRLLEVLKQFSDGKPSLIFCPSRRQSTSSAKALVDNLSRAGAKLEQTANLLTRRLSDHQRRELYSQSALCNDRTLASLMRCGVAYHNAEMTPQHRLLVERLFRRSLIQCLFSTSTLAQGVNLPARLVVILGTAVYYDGSLREYERNILMQMCGRAGRPGLDTKGVAVVMTSKATAGDYVALSSSSPAEIASQLGLKLEDSMNAEIARQFITDMPSAALFVENTFYAVTQRHELHDAFDSKKKLASTVASNTVRALSDTGLARFDDDCVGVSCTAAGISMARYCISFKTMQHLMRRSAHVSSPAEVLQMIAETENAVEGICLRRCEKRALNEVNQLTRFPIHGKVREVRDKVVVLMQVVLADHFDSRSLDYALRSEALRVMEAVSRISRCVVSLALDTSIKTPYSALSSMLQVCRGLQNRCYWDGPTVLQQIPGISYSFAKALVKCGLSTIGSLSGAHASNIDNIVPGKASAGRRVLEHLRSFPKFHVDVVLRDPINAEGQDITIEVRVAVSAQTGHWNYHQNAKERGFVIVGSHSVGLLGSKSFMFKDGDLSFRFRIPHCKCSRPGSWIDVTVGSNTFVGVDVSRRLDVTSGYGKTDAFPKKRLQPPAQQGCLLAQPRRLTLNSFRASKKLKQSTFSHAPPSQTGAGPRALTAPGLANVRGGQLTPGSEGAASRPLQHKYEDAEGTMVNQKHIGNARFRQNHDQPPKPGPIFADNDNRGDRVKPRDPPKVNESGSGDEAETEVSFEEENAIFPVHQAETFQKKRATEQISGTDVGREYDEVFRNLF